MKVLYLANGLPHYFNLVLSKINATPGLEIVVVTPKERSRFIGDGVYQTREGVNFRVIELKEYTLARLCTSFVGLPAVLFKERPHVIVLPEYLVYGFFLRPTLWLIRKFLGIRLILKAIPFRLSDYAEARQQIGTIRPGMSRLKRRILLELSRCAQRMVDAHVNYVDAKKLLGSYGVPSDRIFITRNSPDTDMLAKTERRILDSGNPPQRSPFRMLHVGRLVPQKGVDILVKALPEVCERFPETELIVVGGGPEQERFESLASKLGVSHAARFVGPIYDPVELGRYFLSSSIFVLPGLGGLSINEAMFYRQAVVCSVGDGTEHHLVREGHNGAFFRENDSASLAGALIRLVSNPQELKLMGERSRAIIDSEVNIHTVVTEYIRAIRYACS